MIFSSLSCVSLPCPIPSPLPGADPTSRSPLPPLWPPSTLGRRGPCWSYGWGLISSAHLEAGWGLTGVHKGQGLDLLAVSSIVTQSEDKSAAAQCPVRCAIRQTVYAPTVLNWSSLICLIVPSADERLSLRNPFTPLIKVKWKIYNCVVLMMVSLE